MCNFIIYINYSTVAGYRRYYNLKLVPRKINQIIDISYKLDIELPFPPIKINTSIKIIFDVSLCQMSCDGPRLLILLHV